MKESNDTLTKQKHIISFISTILNKFSVIVGIILVAIIMFFLEKAFLSSRNILIIFLQVATIGLLSIGETLVILSGEIDLSVGSVLALSGVVVALTLEAGVPVPLAIILALAVGTLTGAFTGLIVTKGKVPSFVVTLGIMGVARGISLLLTGGYPVSSFPDSFTVIGGGKFLGIPVPMYLLIIGTLVIWVILKRTEFGRNIYAIGGTAKAAFYSGINIVKNKIFVFTLSGFFAALGGIVMTSRLDAAETIAGQGYELKAIAAVVIGGTSLSGGIGGVLGTLAGTVFIGMINNGMTLLAISSYWQRVVQGSIIILAILLDRLRNQNKSNLGGFN